MTLASRIVVLANRGIAQVGTPLELYERPENEFVAQFIGSPSMNLMPGKVVSTGAETVVELDGGGKARSSVSTGDDLLGADVNVGIRPEDFELTEDEHCHSGRVAITEALGEVTLLYFEQGERDAPIIAKLPGIHRDIRGKIAGKRVADLILDELPGSPPRPRERLRLYASAGVQYDWDDNPESLIDEAVSLADRGYTACKIRLGTAWSWSGVTVERFLELARAVTDAVGSRMELMLEGNSRLDEEQALRIGRWLDGRGWTWFEEPLPKEEVDGYARLNRALSIPITGGESNTRLADFEPFFEKGAYAMGQLDVGVCTLREALRICRRGREFGIPVFTQNWHNGLLTVANAHLLAALPEEHVLEQFTGQGPLQWGIIEENPVADGWFTLPPGPGWGVELAGDLEAKFPWIPGRWGEQEERPARQG